MNKNHRVFHAKAYLVNYLQTSDIHGTYDLGNIGQSRCGTPAIWCTKFVNYPVVFIGKIVKFVKDVPSSVLNHLVVEKHF